MFENIIPVLQDLQLFRSLQVALVHQEAPSFPIIISQEEEEEGDIL